MTAMILTNLCIFIIALLLSNLIFLSRILIQQSLYILVFPCCVVYWAWLMHTSPFLIPSSIRPEPVSLRIRIVTSLSAVSICYLAEPSRLSIENSIFCYIDSLPATVYCMHSSIYVHCHIFFALISIIVCIIRLNRK